MKNKIIVPNLALSECIKSRTAIKYGIDNTPNIAELEAIKLTAEKIFTPIREHFNVPIHISSFFRCPELNSTIGGSTTSAHCLGLAMDIDQDNKNSKVTNKMIFDYIRGNMEFDQLINEYDYSWVHIGIRPDQKDNRNQVMRAIKRNGKTVYEAM